ncbi:MAG TPA: serine/threonine-protein kinase [Polyangiaceae bacterium]|nr:serine/threonine-protein kinase [Polyangiaceae bacterium]
MQPGDLIQSRYRLNRLLGSGASGSVWAAKNELIDRDVALKIMRPDVAEDAVALQRFFNEAKASGRVRSSSIVEILDLGQAEDGSPFLVFELLDGEGLDQRLAREGTLESELACEVFLSVAKALALAHSQGIIHRDLKPANIFLHKDPEGNHIAKILDFGISKIFETNNNFTLTRTGTVVGSPAYMAPEQASGREDLDGRADVWSLGVVMYEALSGTLPHEAPNYNALMVRILTQDVDPLLTRKPDLPPALCAVVDKCLRRDRDQRIESAGALEQQIERALSEIKSVRYRAIGRRASDRAQGQFRRRQSDFSAPEGANGSNGEDHGPPPQRLIIAAALGAIFGVSATAIIFLLSK